MKQDIVACSGGKDSTALALILHHLEVPFDIFWTPTGNEPPGVEEHVYRIAEATGADIIRPEAPTLLQAIAWENRLPSGLHRFCTRMIKIEPCIEWFHEHGRGITLHVGLRADEPERKGIYDELVNRRFMLREMGMDVEDVIALCASKGFPPPYRTDCMLCPVQRIADWYWLWTNYPEEYAHGILLEEVYGHTFRSPSRDTWPTGLADLAVEFASGRPIPMRRIEQRPCRVCTL